MIFGALCGENLPTLGNAAGMPRPPFPNIGTSLRRRLRRSRNLRSSVQSADKNLSDLAGRVFPVVRKLKFLEFGLVPEGRAGMMSAFEMNERETILLDARLESVIEPHAFRAVLGNGHGFTAFVAVRDREKDLPAVNECVKVEMSPANMSTGRILL